MRLAARRKALDRAAGVVAGALSLIALGVLGWILATLLARGLPGLGLEVFVNATAPSGLGGGLANAIVGTLIQVGLGILVGAPIGILAGTYLAEHGRATRLGQVTRFVSDILLSAPSIVVGLFVYQLLVVTTGGFSGIAGVCALAIIAIPIVVRTTEDMLNLVPLTLREAAYALGAPRWKVVTLVSWRAARAGITTGVLLAVARIAGETAPLIFTSLGNLHWSLDLAAPMSSLPITIYQFAASPFEDLIGLAWTGALIITVGVLLLSVVARLSLRGGLERS